jgi:cytoskeletal protein CcmA (bactofilin family)
VRAAGGSITITDRVGGDALLAGGSVTLAPGSRVAGNAWLAGGVLHLSGTVNGNVRAAGGEVVLSGRVDGDSRILADTLEIASGAIIHGTVRYEGPHPPRVEGGAQVGKIVYTERHFKGHGVPWFGGLIASFVIFLSLAISTLILAWIFPNTSREAVRNASERMFLSLGVGLLAAVVTPFIAAALFALLLTTPLGVVVIATMVVLLATGCFVAVACLGSWIRTRLLPGPGERAWFYPVSVVGGALVYWLVALIPFVGVLIVLLAFATGAGGLILLAARLYKPTDKS